MKRTRTFFALPAFVFALFVTGCATTVDMKVLRAPALNVAGIRRIVILPFEQTGGSSEQSQAAGYLDNATSSQFQGIDYYTIVDASMIDQYQRSGENVSNHIDARFRGKVLSASVRDSSRQETRKRKDAEGNEHTDVITIYSRNVELSFEYGFVRTRDGTSVGPVQKQGSASSSAENDSSKLRPVSDLLWGIVSNQMAGLARDVAPYIATERRTLETEKGKDRVLKQLMKEAAKIVTAGNYQAALDTYTQIYNQYKNYAAAFNAAIMQEAVGDLQGALASMQSVAAANPARAKPASEASRLRARIDEEARARGLLDQPQRKADAVTALATATLQSKLPQGSKVSVLNSSSGDRNFVDTIVASISSGLAARGITIVDRSNTALLEAERNYQVSGAVNDADIVGLGRSAGVTAFIQVSITGAGDTRRLQVRVLDVETGTLSYHSPQDSNWDI